MNYKLEVIAFNIESCITAQENGADRIELCDNPQEGGTTPSYGMIKTARQNVNIELYPIIRPRGGDFLYSDNEFEIMKTDIEKAKELGCDGVVIGLLKANGTIDASKTKELVKLALPMGVTFHRAFDRCVNPLEGLEIIIDCGCKRILTSGLTPHVENGKDLIKHLQEKAANRIIIMPGSGLRASNLQEIALFTCCKEFHSSARIQKSSEMRYMNENLREASEHVVLDSNEVRNMKNILFQIQNSNFN